MWRLLLHWELASLTNWAPALAVLAVGSMAQPGARGYRDRLPPPWLLSREDSARLPQLQLTEARLGSRASPVKLAPLWLQQGQHAFYLHDEARGAGDAAPPSVRQNPVAGSPSAQVAPDVLG